MGRLVEVQRGSLLRPGHAPDAVEFYVERPEIIIETFADGDATPSVTSNSTNVFKTANTSATTITTFDDGRVGQVIDIIFGDANTTLDFSGGGNMVNGTGVNATPAVNNQMKAIYDGTKWYCIGTNDIESTGLDNIVEDTTPQLGGQLDVNGQSIKLDDNEEIILGTGDDVRIDFNGTNMIVGGTAGTVNIVGRTVKLMNTDASKELQVVHNGTSGFVGTGGIGGGSLGLGHEGTTFLESQNHLATSSTSGAKLIKHDGYDYDVGFNVLPTMTEDADDTLEARHCGGVYFKDGTVAKTLTLEANSSTDFPVGGVCTILNAAASADITVTEGSSTTLYYLDGSTKTDTTGGCTVGPGGAATLWREDAAVYYIFGSGITA